MAQQYFFLFGVIIIQSENDKEFNVLIIVSIIWIEELEIFIDLHNLFCLPLAANQGPSFMNKNSSYKFAAHSTLYVCVCENSGDKPGRHT